MSMSSRRKLRREQTPVQRALALLARREHSKKELARKLAARGIEADAADAAVARLSEAGWQDDARFAESLVRSRAAAGYGPIRIRAELAMHALDAEAIATAMEAFTGDWGDNARALVRRRYGAKIVEDRGLQRKAADLLLRRGFAARHVRLAVRAF